MKAELIDGRICIDGVEARDHDTLKNMPGTRYRHGQWSMVISWACLKVLLVEFPGRVECGDTLRSWAWQEHAGRIGPAGEAHDWAMDPAHDMAGDDRLYPYQRTGVGFLLWAGSAGLTDEMGTGKTAHAIITLEMTGAYPALVVAPKSAKGGWKREFAKWAAHRDVCIVGGSIAQRRAQLAQRHDVYIMTWESISSHSRMLWWPGSKVRMRVCMECHGKSGRIGDPGVKPTKCEVHPKELNRPWGAVIADEAHRALNPKANQTRALWAIGQSAKIRIPMTGTPVANSPADFWTLLHFISPEEWPSRVEYIDRYCLTTLNGWNAVEVIGLNPYTADEFHALVKPRHLRRPKELVLPWLPPKVWETREVEMSAGQGKIYRELAKEMVAEVKGGTVLTLDPLTKLTRLTQAAASMIEVVPGADGEDAVRMMAPSTKVDALVELLEDMGEEPLVVFAASRQLIDLAAQRLDKEKITYSMIVGNQSDAVRYSNETSFMDGTNRVILLTMGAGSEALTLTRASTTCFLQRSWSLVQNRQAEDRTHRPGQEAEKVLIIDLIAPGTVEEAQWTALQSKGAMMEEIVQDRQAMLAAVLGR